MDLELRAPDEQVAAFGARIVNVDCDETFELGRGASRDLVARDGLGTVSRTVIIDPGRRGSREILITSGDEESRRAAALACVAMD